MVRETNVSKLVFSHNDLQWVSYSLKKLHFSMNNPFGGMCKDFNSVHGNSFFWTKLMVKFNECVTHVTHFNFIIFSLA